MLFAERMRMLRKGRDLTQAQCATALGVSLTQYQQYESLTNPAYPSVARLMEVAQFFDCSIAYLMGEEQVLDENDKELLALFHQLSAEEKANVLHFMNAFHDRPHK